MIHPDALQKDTILPGWVVEHTKINSGQLDKWVNDRRK